MTISVVVAVHNRSRIVGETLASLLAQSRPPDELIVVDDASTDGTPEAVERFGGDVTLVRLRENRGPGGARNAGLAKATCDYIQFFDSDDLASPDLLASKHAAALANSADICYGPWFPVWLEGGICRHDGFVRQSKPVDGNPLERFLEGWVLLVQNCLIRRRLLVDVGGYPETMRTGEDMLLLFRMLQRAPRLVHTSKSLLFLRQHPQTQISTAPEGAALRALDELRLTETVLNEISPETAREHSSALGHWRSRHMRAVQNANGLAASSQSAWGDQIRFKRRALIERVQLAISARVIGHRIQRVYQPQAISSANLDAIRQLGYQPLLNS